MLKGQRVFGNCVFAYKKEYSLGLTLLDTKLSVNI